MLCVLSSCVCLGKGYALSYLMGTLFFYAVLCRKKIEQLSCRWQTENSDLEEKQRGIQKRKGGSDCPFSPVANINNFLKRLYKIPELLVTF